MEILTVRKVSLGLMNCLCVRLLFRTRKGIIHNSDPKVDPVFEPLY